MLDLHFVCALPFFFLATFSNIIHRMGATAKHSVAWSCVAAIERTLLAYFLTFQLIFYCFDFRTKCLLRMQNSAAQSRQLLCATNFETPLSLFSFAASHLAFFEVSNATYYQL